ncbi:predicted protein [Postia placenta Mad-698-R]|uniref:Uncharacterized protein n=1 Tax=Postia placenta MAD-698-R-SB12 TaxID=670580 RepID=A0A1X6NBD1_9APHY|nr:hypothetical protein POSPLADRAFT_1133411 [Postia placenta MAD-698-R-SB12]EED79926.1 predicted protein [Postia placenta Mad-698-R]OSX65830.1 hypothetical protein POSPLADRAFT_1133411 [Postia placenta MAD-698-R-SB12]
MSGKGTFTLMVMQLIEIGLFVVGTIQTHVPAQETEMRRDISWGDMSRLRRYPYVSPFGSVFRELADGEIITFPRFWRRDCSPTGSESYLSTMFLSSISCSMTSKTFGMPYSVPARHSDWPHLTTIFDDRHHESQRSVMARYGLIPRSARIFRDRDNKSHARDNCSVHYGTRCAYLQRLPLRHLWDALHVRLTYIGGVFRIHGTHRDVLQGLRSTLWDVDVHMVMRPSRRAPGGVDANTPTWICAAAAGTPSDRAAQFGRVSGGMDAAIPGEASGYYVQYLLLIENTCADEVHYACCYPETSPPAGAPPLASSAVTYTAKRVDDERVMSIPRANQVKKSILQKGLEGRYIARIGDVDYLRQRRAQIFAYHGKAQYLVMYIAGSHDMGLTDEAQRPGAGLDVPTETGQADHAAEHHAVIDARRPLRHCCFPPSWASRAEATRDRLRKQQRSYWPSTRASPRQFSIGKKPSTHRHYRDEIVLCNGMAAMCCAPSPFTGVGSPVTRRTRLPELGFLHPEISADASGKSCAHVERLCSGDVDITRSFPLGRCFVATLSHVFEESEDTNIFSLRGYVERWQHSCIAKLAVFLVHNGFPKIRESAPSSASSSH